VATSRVSTFEYVGAVLGKPVNVGKNHSLMDGCGAAAGVLSQFLRGAREAAALSDREDEAGTEREERAAFPARWRDEALDPLMYQHPWFVAESIW
jgi:hypothetical protein